MRGRPKLEIQMSRTRFKTRIPRQRRYSIVSDIPHSLGAPLHFDPSHPSFCGFETGSKESQNRQKTKLKRPCCRRGVSLVELLIVISVATVIIGVCVTTIHVLLRSERDQSRAMRTASTISRLTEVFREDVHATSKGVIETADGKPAQLTLTDADGRRIVYLPNEHRLRRIETTDGAEVHRDTFHFPSGSRVRFETDESPRLVRMAIDIAAALPHQMPEGRSRLAPPRTLLIEAVSNRDRRFAGRRP